MSVYTTILPTSRAIRSHILDDQSCDGFISNYLSMGEFMQRALYVDGFKRVDEDTRTLLLLEAADFKNFAALKIERNFFTFTQNASYLFRFFEELGGELVAIEDLELADTYGEYEEHITILQELYLRYRKLCQEKRVLDPIFLPQNYRLNKSYIETLKAIELHVLGYLTNFELKILKEVAEIVPLYLIYSANRFNTKLTSKLREMGMEIVDDAKQYIDFKSGGVERVETLKREINAEVESFSQSLLQVGFIKQKVHALIAGGMDPEKIVVVLPDESFAYQLRRFDDEHNFNFAMGISIEKSRFVAALSAVNSYMENMSVENSARLNRIGGDLLDGIFKHYGAAAATLNFSELMLPFLAIEEDQEVLEILKEELYYFEKILPELGEAPLKSALHLFLKRLKSKSIDDVRGGKITVMGVLETRLVSYDGVIVVSFNEGVVPRKSDKDLFLNAITRQHAGLPTTHEREDLQKLYYHSLFSSAKKVMIAYVSSADAVPTRFLTQLGLSLGSMNNDSAYAPIIMPLQEYRREERAEIKACYDFTKKKLSATGLNTYLTCKRKFYYRYVENLKSHEIAKDMPKEHEIGSALHKALEIVYKKYTHFDDISILRKAVSEALKQSEGTSVLDKYLHKLWMQRLEPFFEHEIERFKSARVKACEKSLEREVCGIRLHGVIDRVDTMVDGLEVLDYKSGKYKVTTKRTLESSKDYQLAFYYLLASTLGEVNGCGFYDLNKGKIVYETLIDAKLEKLYELLESLKTTEEISFEMTEKLTDCSYCEFSYLCERGELH